MERPVGVGNDNPTFPGRNFQRRTFYRGQPIDEKRNPLALYYFAGKEEEQRKFVDSDGSGGCAPPGSGSFQHPFGSDSYAERETEVGKYDTPVHYEDRPVSPPLRVNGSSVENFVLETIRDLEIKAEASRLRTLRIRIEDAEEDEVYEAEDTRVDDGHRQGGADSCIRVNDGFVSSSGHFSASGGQQPATNAQVYDIGSDGRIEVDRTQSGTPL
ncbi:hypothetical protein NDN08_002804 [Rhodosorus marinus]|uniref:Uncharacterized protein n=1 Tax=Rhodosorus marinus TaxID=101924 RepID=A0AAV8V0J0_9RHOD|nr:hypothetical protein NDN08_002804 [Rhodosorus marinus]